MKLGVKAVKLNHRNMKVSSSFLSFNDIRNRNFILFKRASKVMDRGATLGVKFRRGKFLKIEKAEIAERICALDDLEEEVVLSMMSTSRKVSLSLEF